MKVAINSIHSRTLSVALAIGALTVLGAVAHADELDPITVSAPVVKVTGHDEATNAPIEQITVQARIAADAETLRNESGVVLLKDRVLEAAQKVCAAADPTLQEHGSCIRQAIKDVQPQIAAAIAQAKANSVQ